MASSTVNEVLGEIPHIIVLALLLFSLMFVATKYQWVHCAQIPQWCGIYCQINGHSQVAIISGAANDSGMGDPALFARQVAAGRIYTIVVPFTSNQITSGVLGQYELVVLDHFKQISFTQALTLKDYVDHGGSLLWMGDAATNYVSSPNDDAYALALNHSRPGYYEAYKRYVNQSGGKGFGLLGDYLGAQYVTQSSTPVAVNLIQLIPDNPIVSGVRQGYSVTLPYVNVAVNPDVSTQVASLQLPGGSQVPAILDRRYVGRIVYISFPVELANSTTLTQNLMDYLVQC